MRTCVVSLTISGRSSAPAARRISICATGWAALALTFVVDIGASGLLLLPEKGYPQTDIHIFRDALFFTTSQLTTLSSAMANPVPLSGKVLCLMIDIYAITVVTTVAGIFGAFFSHRSADIVQGGQETGAKSVLCRTLRGGAVKTVKHGTTSR